MTQLIECIPNFSEARRPEVIDQIVAAIKSVEGARLLDCSSDMDHNRTVVTFAGSALAVEEAAFRAIKTAAELIDLDQHTGEHPRIGATDVCPFVPLSDATMVECVAIAKRVGERVGSELDIPVYLYEIGGDASRAYQPREHPSAANTRASRPRSNRIPNANLILDRPSSERRAPRLSVRAIRSLPSMSISPQAMSTSPRKSPKQSASPPEGSAMSKDLACLWRAAPRFR